MRWCSNPTERTCGFVEWRTIPPPGFVTSKLCGEPGLTLPKAAPTTFWLSVALSRSERSARLKGGALVVLDSWALVAFLKNEQPAARIEREWLTSTPAVCSINLGEVLYLRIRERKEKAAAVEIEMIRRSATIIDPDWELAAAAAKFKVKGGLAYADAFCIATAERLEAPLWTGDPEIIDQADDLPCAVVDLRA
jgi:predicted nucleic acid-binding protein